MHAYIHIDKENTINCRQTPDQRKINNVKDKAFAERLVPS